MLGLSKKGLHPSFRLLKKRIYLGAHLKEELTDLSLKLPMHSLFLQTQLKEDDEHFTYG